MRAAPLAGLLVASLLLACGGPGKLTKTQWEYVRVHPELTEAGRQAIADREIAVGQTLERVMIALDGLRIDRQPRGEGERLDSYVVYISIDERPITGRGGPMAAVEKMAGGRVHLTFRDQVLVSYLHADY